MGYVKNRISLMASLIMVFAAAFVFIPSANSGDPHTCVDYPEPRIFLEAQGWWSDNETISDGDTQHSHSGVCFPLAPQVVSGNVTFDVVSKMHNVSGFRLRKVRIQDAIDQGPLVDVASVTPGTLCSEHDCTFVNSLTVNTDALAAGMHEFRVMSSIVSPVTGAPQLLATNGYQICIRSCSGVTPETTDAPEGRGWYLNENGVEIGYAVSRFDSLTAFPRTPVSGTWCPPIRTGRGYSGDVPQERSRVVVDPNFHAGDSGRTYLDVSGPFRGTVCINTNELINGSHKLVIISHSTATFDGQLWGVFVVPFTVSNGETPPPPPPPPPVAQCADGLDNDGDGKIDLSDKQCRNSTDNDEKRR